MAATAAMEVDLAGESGRALAQSYTRKMWLVVGIATRGRPGILAETLADLATQVRQPDEVIVSCADPRDLGDAPARFPHVVFLEADLGLTRQRNAILEQAGMGDLLVFLDDDFFLHPLYLETVEHLFRDRPDVVVATGRVLADGINGPGLSAGEARAIVAAEDPAPRGKRVRRAFNAYGCNMCLRLAPVRQHGLRFDEALPLYGWYEDVDFSRRLAPYGSIVHVAGACGVHLGAKSGRTSGLRLGYSQVANPIYLARKRSVSWLFAAASIASRCSKNACRSLKPEPYVDRRGRFRGNLIAFRELLTGVLFPTRILKL